MAEALLGRYEVVGMLGTGAAGEVLRVRDRRHGGRVVALKRARGGANGSLLDEYASLADAQHAGIPTVFDFHPDLGDGRPGYSLEEIDGQPVDEFTLAHGAAVVPAVAAGLFRALDALHGRGLAHGDLHPHNVLVTRGAVGFEAIAAAVRLIDLAPRDSQAFGALPFVAPERLAGGLPSAASDAFAAGVLLYRLLTGELPYPDYPVMPDVPPGDAARARLGALAPVVLGLIDPAAETRTRRMGRALEQLAQALGTPLPLLTADSASVALRSAPLAGPAAAPGGLLARGQQALSSGGVVIVSGPPGSGRSRLLSALHRAALRPGAGRVVCLRPEGTERAGTLAEAALVPAKLARSEMEPSPTDGGRAYAIAVLRVAQAIAGPPGAPATTLVVDDADRLSPFDADVLRALSRMADARRSRDPASGRAARTAAEAFGRVSVAVAGSETYLAAVRADAASSTTLELPPFTDADVADWLRGAFGGRPASPGLVRGLTVATGGNAGLLVQAVDTALRAGHIVVDDASVAPAAGAPDPLPLPSSAEEAARAAVERLAPAEAGMLAILALAPVPVPEAMLVPLAPDAPALLDRLVRGGLALRRTDRDTRLTAATPAIATAARGLAVDPRWLEALAESEEEDLAARAVSAAIAVRDEPSEAKRALAAARELLEGGRARPALALAELVLEKAGRTDARLLGDARAFAGDEEGALRAYADLPAVEAARARGGLLVRRGRYREALEALQGVPDSAETLGWLARSALMLGRYDEALAACDRARALGSGDPRLGFVRGLVAFYRADYPAALAAFAGARAALEAAGELVERANVINAVGLVHYRRAELDQASAVFQEALALAAESGDAERAFLTLMNVAVIEQSRGAYGLAEARYVEALHKARLGGHRAGVMRVAQNLGNLYRWLGDTAEARRLLDESRALATAEGNAYMLAYADGLLGEVALMDGDLGRAEERLRGAIAGFQALGNHSELADARYNLSVVLAARGDLDGARTEAETALAATAEPAVPVLQALTRLQLAELARRSGDTDAALAHAVEAEKLGDALQSRPELKWQIPFVLHRVRRDRGEASEALELGTRALGALESLADTLPESRREQFVGTRARREALGELRWLRGVAGGRTSGTSNRLQRLLDVNQRLSEEHDPARLIEYIIDSAILLTAAERGFLLMKNDAAEGGLDVVVARNIDQENIRNKRYKVSYSIAERVFETGEPVITTDAMGDDRYSQYLSIHHLKLRSVLCVPLRRSLSYPASSGDRRPDLGHPHADRATGNLPPAARIEVAGALYMDNRFQTNAFSPDDLMFMEAFAHQAAIALGNAQLLEERAKALTELAASQKRVEELNLRLTERLAEKEKALEETERLLVVHRRQLSKKREYEEIIGDSPPIRAVFHVLDRVRDSDVPVLVTGESGTGKELVARAIHTTGGRKDKPFIAINCSSIPETLIESELFGHVRGSFTGATGDKKGVFEAADKGTLFLDEIGEMPLEMQAKLLRALQQGEIQKVGSPRTIRVDVRIIAATNRSLRDMIRQKTFREDLFYRLAVVTLELPALRERPEDIPLLIQAFVEKNKKAGLGRVEHVSQDVLRLLMRYPWPGNVRELETVIKNASIFCETDTLRPEDLANFPAIVGAASTGAAPTAKAVRPLADLEKDAIVHALEVFGGNKKKTAEELGIDRRTLYNKLSMYGIAVERRAHLLDQGD